MLVQLKPHPLKQFFENKNVKQWEIAHILGCSQQTVSLILRGIKPSSEKIEKGFRKIVKKIDAQK